MMCYFISEFVPLSFPTHATNKGYLILTFPVAYCNYIIIID